MLSRRRAVVVPSLVALLCALPACSSPTAEFADGPSASASASPTPEAAGAALTDLAEKRPGIELIRHGTDLYAVRSIDARTFFRGDLFHAVYEWFDFIDHDLPAALPPVRKPGPVVPRSRGPKLVNRVPSLRPRPTDY